MLGGNTYSSRQKLLAGIIAAVNFFSAICVSLQSPFYPNEAEKKGATSAGYGLVFGIFELTVFIVSPIFGKYLSVLGIKRCFNWGIIITGSCCIIFGTLDLITDPTIFIVAGILVRALEALGNSAFLTSSFSIIAQEFTDNVATMFSAMEMCFGIGLIVGPTLGSYLYSIGGFLMPFVSLGTVLLIAAVIALWTMPSVESLVEDNGNKKKKGVADALMILPIALACLSVFASSMSIGFLQANLEPHIRRFNISSMTVGLLFMLNGASYALMTPIFGWICDNKVDPKYISMIGNFLIMMAFIFLGPAPGVPLSSTFTLTVIAISIHGIGLGCCLVSGFSDAHKEMIRNDFGDNLDTYGLISGLWTSTFALGAFVGPSLGGFLQSRFGFSWSSMLVICFTFLSVFLSTLYSTIYVRFFGKKKNELIENPDDKYSTTFMNDDSASLSAYFRKNYGSLESPPNSEAHNSSNSFSSTGYDSLGGSSSDSQSHFSE